MQSKLRIIRAAVGLLLAMGLLCVGARAQDDPPGRVGRIAAVRGDVQVFEPEQGQWATAVRNRPLTQGDRLATDAASAVELEIGSTIVYLGAASDLEALRLDDERVILQLHQGSVALRVRSNEVADELEVLTAEGSFLPQRSGAYRVDRRDDGSDGSVWGGDLQFVAPGFRQMLASRQRARFWRAGAQQDMQIEWQPPLNDDFALAFGRIDEAVSRVPAPAYVSAEMTGVDDLDRYGSWQDNPDVGAVWVPQDVSAGWAPYRDGHWAWVRPWGWTWVDNTPWGFAPFHYGRWLYWRDRWCWTPGPRVRNPVYAPALVAWVGGPNFSLTIGARTTPAVGWIPLGPREAYRPGYRVSPHYLDRINRGRRFESAPTYFNRGAPGAVTMVRGGLVPRRPVAGAIVRVDDRQVQRALRDRQFTERPPSAPRPDRQATVPPRAGWPGAQRSVVPPARSTTPALPSPRPELATPRPRPDPRIPQPPRAAEPFRSAPASPPTYRRDAPTSTPPQRTQRPDRGTPEARPGAEERQPRGSNLQTAPPSVRSTVPPPARQPLSNLSAETSRAPIATPTPTPAQRGRPFVPPSAPPAAATPQAAPPPAATAPAARAEPGPQRRRMPPPRDREVER